MITVISGTNRPNSRTKDVANVITDLLKAKDQKVQLLALDEMDWTNLTEIMYDPKQHTDALRQADEQYMIGTHKWIIVSPEYNGSFPGILKLFFDAISTHRYADTFVGKHAMLVGVAAGRAGNLRGMEHLTGFLNYLKVHVFPQKLPISSIEQVMEGGDMNDATKDVLSQHLDAFIAAHH